VDDTRFEKLVSWFHALLDPLSSHAEHHDGRASETTDEEEAPLHVLLEAGLKEVCACVHTPTI
jgi:hypothetical protein